MKPQFAPADPSAPLGGYAPLGFAGTIAAPAGDGFASGSGRHAGMPARQ